MSTVVSVCIITYNSSEYIVETLDSIYHQTYPEIELIISDDKSSDDTCRICRDWIARHQHRFAGAKLIEARQNTGITGNVNRGWKNSTGTWIKLLGGDDCLTPDCIEKMVAATRNSDEKCFFCDRLTFGAEETLLQPPAGFVRGDAAAQLKWILRSSNAVSGTALFVARDVIEQLGGFDESFEMLDDYPFVIKALTRNLRFEHVPYALVRYRVHPGSVLHIGSPRLNNSYDRFCRQVILPLQRRHGLWLYYWHTRCDVWRRERRRQIYHLAQVFHHLDPLYYRAEIGRRLKRRKCSK